MILQVLLVLIVRSSAITLEFRHITEQLSWSDAYISGLCNTSHYVTGYVTPESVRGQSSLTDTDVPEAWVGMYGISTKFLKFDGCFMFEENALNGDNIPKVSLKEGADSIGACYEFCNESLFGLSMDTCYCVATLSPSSSGLCNVNSFTGIWFCKPPGGGVCGGGLIQQTGLRCLCVYRVRSVGTKVDISLPGNCVSYDVRGSETMLDDCNTPKNFVCTENTTQRSVIFHDLEHSWWNAALMCQSSAQVFGNRSSVLQYMGSPNSTVVDAYWTNKFRKQFFSFASPGKDDNYVQCVAVRMESGEFYFFLRDCREKLPALCFSVNQEVELPEKETNSVFVSLHAADTGTSVQSTTKAIGQEESSTSGREGIVYAVEISKTWPVVYVVLGILLIIVTILGMCYRKRSMTTSVSMKPDKINPPPKPKQEVVNSAIATNGNASQVPPVPRNETLQSAPTEPERYTSLALAGNDSTEHAYMEIGAESKETMTTTDTFDVEIIDMKTQSEVVAVSSNDLPNGEDDNTSANEEMYNELNEKESTLEATYDHTVNPEVLYDEIGGGSRESKALDDALYDVIEPLK